MKMAAVLLLLCATAASWAAGPNANPGADRCRAHGSVDTCYDAIRRSPSDPSLLVALGEAFEREKRPADAMRTYRRAAGLAPADRTIIAKIAALEGKPVAKKVAAATPPRPAAAPARVANDTASRRYSNTAPESQSH